jgi:hypothetical protein
MPHQLAFALDSGRSIRLVSLEEHLTCGGLLAGYPRGR